MKIYRHERKLIIKHLLSDTPEYILKEAEDPQFVPRSQLTLAKPELERSGEVGVCKKPCSGIQKQQLLPSTTHPPRTGSDCEILKALQGWERVEPAIPQTKCLPSLKATE